MAMTDEIDSDSGPARSAADAVDELRASGGLDALFAKIDSGELQLTGAGGFVPELIKAALERGLQAELSDHLGYDKGDPDARHFPNSRNGATPKTVRSEVGDLDLAIPRDRAGTFIPRLVPKGSRRLGGLDDMIISLYAGGMTLRDIRHHLASTIGTDLSHETISKITDEVLDEVLAWQRRPLESLYPVIYLDALVVKVRDGAHVRNKAAHIAVGVDMDGIKHVLGIWVQQTEGAAFWAGVCAELANRGVKDVLIVCCDGLSGFPEAIEATWPHATVQTCVVHLIRASTRFVGYQDRKKVAAALRPIYTASNADAALEALIEFQASELGRKYPNTVKTFEDAWERLANSSDDVNHKFNQMVQGINTGNIDQLTKKMAALVPQTKDVGLSWKGLGGVVNQVTGGIFGKTLVSMEDQRRAAIDATIAIGNQTAAVTALGGEFGISTDRVAELAGEFGVNLADGTVTSTQKFEDMYKSLGTMPEAFKQVQNATTDTTKAQQAYNDAVTTSINLASGQQGALIQFNSDLMHLKDNLAGASRDLSDNTDAGITNQQAILKVAGDFSSYIGDLQKSNVPMNQQQTLTDGLTKKFADQMHQLGWTTDQVDAYLTKIGLVPPQKVTVFSTPGLPAAITSVTILGQKLSSIQDKTVTLAINAILNDQGVAASAAQMMLGLSPSSVKLPNGQTAAYNSGGSNPLTAGIPGASVKPRARGGLTSEKFTLLGEQGPEIVQLPRNSMVHTASQTKAMLSGGGDTHVHLTIQAMDAQSFERWLRNPGIATKIGGALSKLPGQGVTYHKG